MYTNQITASLEYSPCFLLFPIPFCSLFIPLYLLGTLLAVTGSVHLVSRLLINWLPISLPWLIYPPSWNPDPLGFPSPNIHSLGRHCEPSSQDRAQAGLQRWWPRPTEPTANASLCASFSVWSRARSMGAQLFVVSDDGLYFWRVVEADYILTMQLYVEWVELASCR
jgi:hypothetical protein